MGMWQNSPRHTQWPDQVCINTNQIYQIQPDGTICRWLDRNARTYALTFETNNHTVISIIPNTTTTTVITIKDPNGIA